MAICIIVAFKAEALPLIEAFSLTPLKGSHPFPIWENETFKLILSGLGKVKAGSVCSYIAALYPRKEVCGYLNIGIGGHPTFEIGTPLLAHKIIDQGNNLEFFPSFPFNPPCKTAVCMTVETPEYAYDLPLVYEMESAGFYLIASKLAPLELVHVFKVISDNKEYPVKKMSKEIVYKLIGDNIEIVKSILESMHSLAKTIIPNPLPTLDPFIKRWRFTACQKILLEKYLKRWDLLFPKISPSPTPFLEKKSAKDVLISLEAYLNAIPLH